MVLHLQTFQIVTQDALNVVRAMLRATTQHSNCNTSCATCRGTERKPQHRYKPGEVSHYLSEFTGT